MKQKIITIFGSGKVKKETEEYQTAFKLGSLIAESGFVICNGGYGGIMEATAAGAKSKNGKTIGVLVEEFGLIPNNYIDETIITKSLLERLSKLIQLGKAYVVLPGASGTLVEIALVWEYIIKGLMEKKPIIIIGNFWNNVVDTINKRLSFEGNLQYTDVIKKVDSVEECADYLKKYFTNY